MQQAVDDLGHLWMSLSSPCSSVGCPGVQLAALLGGSMQAAFSGTLRLVAELGGTFQWVKWLLCG